MAILSHREATVTTPTRWSQYAHLFALFALGCATFVSAGVGCSRSAPPNQSSGKSADQSSGKSADASSLPLGDSAPDGNSQDQSHAATVLQELESLGAELRSNAKSQAIESADCSKLEINDLLAEKLARLDSLVQLVIKRSSMTDQGWESLSRLKSLQHLDLRECPISSSQLLKLVSSTPKLRSLRLSGKAGNCSVDDSGLEFLKDLADLKVLALDGVKIGDSGLKSIGQCSKLTELYLSETLISDATLSQFSALRELKKLRLAQTNISSSGLAHLAGLPIEELDVSQCINVDDVSCVEIAKLTALKRLNLWKSSISDQGLQPVGQLTRLQWLNLDNTKVTDAGLPSLAALSNLGFLHLGSTEVSDNGLPSVAALKSLKNLVVTRTKVTQDGVDKLQKLMPAIDIQLKYVPGQ